ncbi:MAG: beta-ketoacyl-ACP synthase II [Candidatus Ancaeobacter aquaticus]|nr:beta-ketoacyl-ACP synthase II [Candidatus Ancaeobacter aquaticus]
MELQRVVVTGLGVLSPVGNTKEEFWNSLCEGKSGIGPNTRMDVSDYSSKIAGELKNFDTSFLSKKDMKRMDLFVQYSVVAAGNALRDTGVDLETADKDRIGVFVGSGIGGIHTIEEQHTILMNKGPERISPFLIPMLIVNMAPGQISITYGLRGPNLAAVTACATGTHCIGEAYRTLAMGDADMILAGGSESALSPLGVGGFCAMRALSTRNDEPEKASRPFDRDRDGFIIAEGAGIVALETLESAKRRGAHIYAEVVGYGLTGDGYHMTSPSPTGDGAARCMASAIKSARLDITDVDYINAHGTSTQLNDKFETLAIKSVFKEYAKKVAISSTKSMTGHLLGAAGGVEFIACALAVENNIIPPTTNLDNPDPECDLDYVPNVARETNVNIAISNSLGFGGHNTTVVVKKFKG